MGGRVADGRFFELERKARPGAMLEWSSSGQIFDLGQIGDLIASAWRDFYVFDLRGRAPPDY